VPLALFHVATRLSLATQLGPGSSAWYLPVPLGIVLIHWWGPRVLLGLYVSSVLSTTLWGLPDWRVWPLYAAPETLEVFLSYYLFSKVAGGAHLNEVIEEVLGMVRRVLGSHIEVRFAPGEPIRPVRVDRGQIEQILLNLCVNSRDAMPEGGTISIETRQMAIDEAFCRTAPWARPGNFTAVSVHDTGSGIPPEIRDRIFEPFFTTKEVGKGTGLGLATVYGIVRQHHGLIDVRSEVGRGATFDIYFPMAEAEVARPEPHQRRASRTAAARPSCWRRTRARCATLPSACSAGPVIA
jgi:hypothetical protein